MFSLQKNVFNMRFLLLILSLRLSLSEQHVISTAQGRLRGEVREGYISYRGVPYASVASPDGRFKRGGLAPRWQGVRESQAVQCSETSRVEQCLQLDVHVPAAGEGARPVLAWVAAAGPYHPGMMAREGIIVALIYHRIGPQGFLCLGEDKIPGNAGAKDVVLALRWIRDNIVAFKGDPAKVVLAGQGFGAAVAEALMLSPMASGLYHGVILQSGSILSPWAFNYDAKQRATKLSRILLENNNVSATLFELKIEDMVDKSNNLDMPYFSFGMCVENAMKQEERLISEAPYGLLSSKKVANVPMIIGYNSDEAYIFASTLREARVTKTISRKVTFLLPEELKFLNNREMKQVAKQVEDNYFKSEKSLRAVLDYHRDAYFLNHIHRSARLHASSSHPVYYYQFSYSGERGVQEEPGVQKSGAAHSDELAYLFSGKDLNGDEKIVQMNFIKLWTNFIKYMNPTFQDSMKWDEMDPEHVRLLDIGTELNMVDFPHSQTATLWNEIYEKYYYSRNRQTG